jgi:hypothetical protein
MRGGFHLQNDSTRGGRRFQLLSTRDARCPPQIEGQDNSIGSIELHDCCHAKSMAWLWRGCKRPEQNVGGPSAARKAAKEHLAREGYDPVYGARPLKRFLQRAIETPLSRKLISGEVTDHTRVTGEFKKGELTFSTSRIKGGK